VAAVPRGFGSSVWSRHDGGAIAKARHLEHIWALWFTVSFIYVDPTGCEVEELGAHIGDSGGRYHHAEELHELCGRSRRRECEHVFVPLHGVVV